MVIAVTILSARQRSRTFRLVKKNDQVKLHEISSITDSVVGASPTSAVSVKGRFFKLFAELNLGADSENRTRATRSEAWDSTTKLYPQLLLYYNLYLIKIQVKRQEKILALKSSIKIIISQLISPSYISKT